MVVAVGLTLVEPLADVEVNVPGVMAMLVAPLTDQLSVLLEPEVMLVGLAVKELIVGADPVPEFVPEVEVEEVETPPQRASVAQANTIGSSVQSPGRRLCRVSFFPRKLWLRESTPSDDSLLSVASAL